MNHGQFAMSSPLSWTMYLVRKNRAATGFFGKDFFIFLLKSFSLHCNEIEILIVK